MTATLKTMRDVSTGYGSLTPGFAEQFLELTPEFVWLSFGPDTPAKAYSNKRDVCHHAVSVVAKSL
ncbi:MAG: hypothetical protein LBU06_10055 [Desulfovibrio sp.]|jgi:hypothetical protein|nr:hypothetical protein [Desulfovibrio sp.]